MKKQRVINFWTTSLLFADLYEFFVVSKKM